MNKADDAFAQTLMDGMNELGQNGWQFLRVETLEEDRRSLLRNSQLSHEYMVYRRPMRSNGMTLDTPVSPARIRKAAAPNIELLRARIGSVMSEPEKLVAVAH
ncbi:MAG: hypothetical protein V3U96_10265 [Paracoccaceae bacterium]